MGSRKFRKSDKDLRSALWIAYDKKDFYKDDIILYREMEVDHIIPQDVFKDNAVKKNILEKLALEDDFEMNSLENFIPTRRGTNSSKGNKIELSRILTALAKAKEKKEKVLDLIDKYNEESDLISETTKVAILADTEEKKQLVADIIFDEEEEFEDEEYLLGDQFTKSISRVRIQAILPTLKEINPGCAFKFRPLKLRECTISLNHKDIFHKLFIGNGNTNLEKRPFIGYKLEDGSYTIQLGNCFFSLSESETIELCKIVDRYNKLYFERLEEIENEYSLNGMTVSRRGEIKICTLKKDFCILVFDFINSQHRKRKWNIFDFIYSKYKDKKWDIFEFNRSSIKVFTEGNSDYNYGYHAIIQVREEAENYFWYSSREVGLYLQPYYDDYNFKISKKDWWSPEYVRKWLFEELFPESIKQYYTRGNKRNRYKINYIEECKKYYTAQENKELRIHMFSLEELAFSTRVLQSFYSIHIHREIIFSNGTSKLYTSFEVLVNTCESDVCISYIAGNLGSNLDTMNDLKEYIGRKKIENVGKLTYSQIEMLLRCFIECIEVGMSTLSASDYKVYWMGLEELLLEYNYYARWERYLLD